MTDERDAAIDRAERTALEGLLLAAGKRRARLLADAEIALDDVLELIDTAVEAGGMSIADAAKLGGISKQTTYNRKRRNEG